MSRTINRTKEALPDHLVSEATWREVRAEYHPDDERNEAPADALQKEADYVRSLPDNAPRLSAPKRLESVTDRVCLAAKLTSRTSPCGFDWLHRGKAGFLTDLANSARADSEASGRDAETDEAEQL